MSVVTVADYRAYTGDQTTADVDVQPRLDRAQKKVEDFLLRKLDLDTYTERLKVHAHNKVYPTVTPIQSLVNPTDYQHDDVAVCVGWNWDFLIETQWRRYADITYVGGYDNTTLPETIREAICVLAFYLKPLSAIGTGTYPAGAKAVKLGDASVTFDKAFGVGVAIEELVPGLSGSLSGYKYRY